MWYKACHGSISSVRRLAAHDEYSAGGGGEGTGGGHEHSHIEPSTKGDNERKNSQKLIRAMVRTLLSAEALKRVHKKLLTVNVGKKALDASRGVIAEDEKEYSRGSASVYR